MEDLFEKNQTTLTIADPPKYGVIIEDDIDNNESPFYQIYKDALKNVGDIITTNENNKKDATRNEEMFNTVIAFVGKRGSGKSTAMYSFSQFLENGRNVSKYYKQTGIQLPEISFHSLMPIDSAQLGVKETIIGRISAAMYHKYEEVIGADHCRSISTEKKRDFVKTLTEVNKYAVMYQTGDWFKSGESLLDDTYNVSMLRQNMSELVGTYLKLISGKDNPENDYLVISIDDLDMGIENSYTIMEEIRKFLCIRNTVVLITLRMDQVHLSLKAKFEKQLETKLDAPDDKAQIDDLAYRYAEKLFPHDRQHQMPVLSAKQLNEWRAKFEEENDSLFSVRNAVIKLVWRKTRIILVPNQDEEHLLIPHNLRSLSNFVVFLRGMKEVRNEKDKEEQNILRENIKEFSQYLVSNTRSFDNTHVSEEDRKFADELISVIYNMGDIPLKRINSFIVGEILYYLQQCDKNNYYRKYFDFSIKYKTDDEKNKTTELTLLLDSCSHPECISVGDLMYVLGKIDNKSRCRYIRYLIEVIRTLWSAKMTEEYYVTSEEKLFAADSDYLRAIGSMIVNPDVGFWGDDLDFEYAEFPIFSKRMTKAQRLTSKNGS